MGAVASRHLAAVAICRGRTNYQVDAGTPESACCNTDRIAHCHPAGDDGYAKFDTRHAARDAGCACRDIYDDTGRDLYTDTDLYASADCVLRACRNLTTNSYADRVICGCARAYRAASE